MKAISAPLAVALFANLAGCALDEQPDPFERSNLAGQCFTVEGHSMDGAKVQQLEFVNDTVKTVAELAPTADYLDISSLGFVPDGLITCNTFDLVVFDLATKEMITLPYDCDGVTADGSTIWVNSIFDGLTEYPSLEALYANQPSRNVEGPYASRLGLGEGHLMASWHSAAEVLTVDARNGVTTPVPLPNYDGWIFGIAETQGKRLVVGGWVEKGIWIYDAATGEYERTAFPDREFQGLICGTDLAARHDGGARSFTD